MEHDTAPKPIRRRRRTQAEVRQRILDAAHEQFAERGFHAATTREIARQADVSETLVFRHFGSKSNLLNEVMFKPFADMAARIFAELEAGSDQSAKTEPWSDLIRDFLAFLSSHRRLFTAMALVGVNFTGEPAEQANLATTQSFFDRVAEELTRRHPSKAGGLDPAVAVRLGFAMIVAAELFGDWLFASNHPGHDKIASTISRMLLSR